MIKKNIKFDIQVPQTVIESLRLYKKNGNDIWRDGIAKEINEVMIALKLIDEGGEAPSYLSGDHMSYDF